MKHNGVDQYVYHSVMIVGNHCMTFDENGSKIIDTLTKAIRPKIKDASKKLKNVISLWYKMMTVMK